MLKTGLLSVERIWSGVRAFFRDEKGSVVIEMGYCSIVLAVLIGGIYIASLFSSELADDLRDARFLLRDLI